MLFPLHQGWDPLLQRIVEASAVPKAKAVSTAIPAATRTRSKAAATRAPSCSPVAPSAPFASTRARVLAAASRSPYVETPPAAASKTPQSPAQPPQTRAQPPQTRAQPPQTPAQPPQTPAQLEEESLKLAWRLQQEEQSAFYQANNPFLSQISHTSPISPTQILPMPYLADLKTLADLTAHSPHPPTHTSPEPLPPSTFANAFYQAMSASTPQAPRVSAGGDGAGGDGSDPDLMETEGADTSLEDASLQLALRLQQEELRWQQLASRRSVGSAVDDEELEEAPQR